MLKNDNARTTKRNPERVSFVRNKKTETPDFSGISGGPPYFDALARIKTSWVGMGPKTNVYDGVEIIADPTAKVSLAGYYLYHLNRFTGWDVAAEKNEFWTTVKFTYLFR